MLAASARRAPTKSPKPIAPTANPMQPYLPIILVAGLLAFLAQPLTAILALRRGVASVILAGIRVKLFGVWWLDGALTLLWIVGITNAVNLMDNMDGLAAGISLVGALFFFAMAALEGQVLVAGLAAALAGAAGGF